LLTPPSSGAEESAVEEREVLRSPFAPIGAVPGETDGISAVFSPVSGETPGCTGAVVNPGGRGVRPVGALASPGFCAASIIAERLGILEDVLGAPEVEIVPTLLPPAEPTDFEPELFAPAVPLVPVPLAPLPDPLAPPLPLPLPPAPPLWACAMTAPPRAATVKIIFSFMAVF